MLVRAVVTLSCMLALLSGMPSAALACRCAGLPSPLTAYQRADVVVVARILTVMPNPGQNGGTALVRVSRAWKEDIASEITVATDSTCAYTLMSDREDLLYLSKNRLGLGGYGTSRCDGNQHLSEATQTLQWLHRHGRAARVVPR